VAAGRPFAKTAAKLARRMDDSLRGARDGAEGRVRAAKLARRMDDSLSACQLGITMASLGPGRVGEPAFARLLEPVLEPSASRRPRRSTRSGSSSPSR